MTFAGNTICSMHAGTKSCTFLKTAVSPPVSVLYLIAAKE